MKKLTLKALLKKIRPLLRQWYHLVLKNEKGDTLEIWIDGDESNFVVQYRVHGEEGFKWDWHPDGDGWDESIYEEFELDSDETGWFVDKKTFDNLMEIHNVAWHLREDLDTYTKETFEWQNHKVGQN